MAIINRPFFYSLHLLLHIPVFWFGVVYSHMNIGYILLLRLLPSPKLNVEFYRNWRDQRPQFKLVYYLWPKLSQMNDL